MPLDVRVVRLLVITGRLSDRRDTAALSVTRPRVPRVATARAQGRDRKCPALTTARSDPNATAAWVNRPAHGAFRSL